MTTNTSSSKVVSAHILVVDDEPHNRELLRDQLSHYNYRVSEAKDGLEALAKVAEDPPDVILMDVMMPGMDGFETTQKILAQPENERIPILITTALEDRESVIRGIEAGARDFLTKPLDLPNLLLRVRNALHIKQLHDRVDHQLEEVRGLERMRDGMVHMLVHDLRSPLQTVVGFSDLLAIQMQEDMSQNHRSYLASIKREAERVVGMVSDILDVSRMESDSGLPMNATVCGLEY